MKILSIFGTRPEAIKMAPVLGLLENDTAFESKICVTAQHRQMLDQVLNLFGLQPNHDLNIMQPDQDLFDITSRTLILIRDVLLQEQPDVVLVQGDTTTSFVGALAAFYCNIPVGHVEAGLRTGNIRAPFPEEANRCMTSRLAKYHFAPTREARDNLLLENIPKNAIWVTGNTVIDALLQVKGMMHQKDIPQAYGSAREIISKKLPYVLITGHRRENFGQGFLNICHAIADLAAAHPDLHFIYPVHLNPHVQKPVYDILNKQNNIHLIAPLDYAPFVLAMDRALFILTDSGGVQEEAPSLGKPVLVMRETTERPEAVTAGTVMLVGTNRRKIIEEAERLITDSDHYRQMAARHNPYGDGQAAGRIIQALQQNWHNSNSA
jgi:UDP-N-acetylglucosamine 2-epimerase (non-hydrolysing)